MRSEIQDLSGEYNMYLHVLCIITVTSIIFFIGYCLYILKGAKLVIQKNIIESRVSKV